MVLIRRFEEKTGEMYTRAKIGGYCHLNLGEEATIVGVTSALEPSDYMFTNYREHGYVLARGVDPNRIMAELFGKETGVSRGRGGSMHLFDVEARFMGGYAIVGGQLPLATGAGLAIAHKGLDEVVVCQMGDATTNIGALHESLNIAAALEAAGHLPDRQQPVRHGHQRREGLGGARSCTRRRAPSACTPSGWTATTCWPCATPPSGPSSWRARRSCRPSWRRSASAIAGHSVVDPDRYRPRELVEQGRALDPIPPSGGRSLEAELIDEGGLKQIDAQVDQMVEKSVAFADESPEPAPKDLYVFDYATEVPNIDRSLPGDHTGLADSATSPYQ